MLNRLKKIEPRKIVIAFLVVYFIIFSLAVSLKHLSMQTALFDFSLEEQVIRKTSEGNLFASGVEVNNYLGDHFSPLPIVLSAALYKVLPSDFTILLIQPLLAVIGLWYSYKLTVHFKIRTRFAILFTILMGLVPGIQCAVIFDYHPIFFAFPILLAAIYYDKKGKLLLSFALFFLACFVKEDVGLFVAGYGILQMLEKKKVGVLLTIIGLGITYITMFYLILGIRGEESDSLLRYAQFGSNGVEIAKNIIFNPIHTIRYLATFHTIEYLLILFIPFLFIPILRIKELIFIFLPPFAINIFAGTFSNQIDGRHHYDVVISVALGYMLILGFQKLQDSKKIKEVYFKVLTILFIGIIVLLPFWKLVIDMSRITSNNLNDYFELGKIIDQNFKKDSVIGASNLAGAHLSSLDSFYLVYPEGWIVNKVANFDYILFYRKEFRNNDESTTLAKYANYNIIYESPSYILLKAK